jgi:Predicted membrane protein (DUF2231)
MSTVNGLPAHVLLVHAVVVLLPLSAVLLVLTAIWPAVRLRLAGPNALLALFVLVLVPITTDAGEWLEHRVTETDLVEKHAELGDTAIWVALPVAAMAVAVWWRDREARGEANIGGRTYLAPGSAIVTKVIAIVSIVVAGVAIFDVYRIGDSGARSAWEGEFQAAPIAAAPAHLG